MTTPVETPSSTDLGDNRRQLERNKKTLEKLREASGITPHHGPEEIYYQDRLGRTLSKDHVHQPLGLEREISDPQTKKEPLRNTIENKPLATALEVETLDTTQEVEPSRLTKSETAADKDCETVVSEKCLGAPYDDLEKGPRSI